MSVTESNDRPLPNLFFFFFFKYQYVGDAFPFFTGTICTFTIDYCYVQVKGAFVCYIFSFDKILFQSLSSNILFYLVCLLPNFKQ